MQKPFSDEKKAFACGDNASLAALPPGCDGFVITRTVYEICAILWYTVSSYPYNGSVMKRNDSNAENTAVR